MTDLPDTVRSFIEVVNAHDEQGFLDAFTLQGVVDDWGREFVGREEIKGWSDNEFIGANGTMDVQEASSDDTGTVTVVADWRSTHANGLSRFTFEIEDDKISKLTIRGAD